VRIDNAEITSSGIQRLLIKNNIIIRDCSNFIGLSDKYFRVAVKTREENQKLLSALNLIMDDVASKEIRGGLCRNLLPGCFLHL
jgi:threonine-phosphate decarboxylase